MSKFRTLIPAVAIAALLAACAGDDDKKPNPQEENRAPIAAVQADPTSAVVGATIALDASASSDPDGDELSFSWALAAPEGSAAELANETGPTNSFVADVAGTYSVTVTVDDGELQASRTVTVSVTEEPGENHAPTANAGANQTVHVGEMVALDGSASSDPDGDPLEYAWTMTVPEGSLARLDEPAAVKPTFIADVVGIYTITLVVNDGELDSEPATVTVEATNGAPSVNAGADIAIELGDSVTLTGTATDPDGDDIVTVRWEIVEGGATASLTVTDRLETVFTATAAGSYVVELTATDEFGATGSDSVTITVNEANALPVLTLPEPITAYVGDTVEIEASATDEDGDELTWSWEFTVYPGATAPELIDADTATPSFTVPAKGAYTLTATVSDGIATVSGSVAVDVPNRAPTVDTATELAGLVDEAIALTATATDPDGDTLVALWTIVEGAETASLANADTLAATFTATEAGTWVVRLTVTDGDGSYFVDVTIVVSEPVNQAPTAVAIAAEEVVNLVEGATIELSGAESTDPDGDDLEFLWTLVSKPEASEVEIDDPTLVEIAIVPDVAGTYVFELVVSDGELSSAPAQVEVYVNAAPVVDAGEDATYTVGDTVTLVATVDDLDSVTVTWSQVSGPEVAIADPSQLEISFVASEAGVYVFEVTADDGRLTASDQVTVTVEEETVARPIADAGEDQLGVLFRDTVTLSGNGTDANGQPTTLTFFWSFVSRPRGSTVELDDPTSPTPSFTPDVGGDYVLQLVVNDGTTDSLPDQVLVRTTCLLISEYIEGTGTNKGIEIWNCGADPIDLSGHSLCLAANTNTNCGTGSMNLSGTLGPNDVLTICNTGITSGLGVTCDLTNNTVINFNGDDRLQLRRGSTVIDAFGDIATQPSSTIWADRTYHRTCVLRPFLGGTFNVTDFFEEAPLHTTDYFGLPPDQSNCD